MKRGQRGKAEFYSVTVAKMYMLSRSNAAGGNFLGVFLRSNKTTRMARESLRTSLSLSPLRQLYFLLFIFPVLISIHVLVSEPVVTPRHLLNVFFLKKFSKGSQSQHFLLRIGCNPLLLQHQSGKAARPSSLNPEYRSIIEADESVSRLFGQRH